jgi:hypothetical protein
VSVWSVAGVLVLQGRGAPAWLAATRSLGLSWLSPERAPLAERGRVQSRWRAMRLCAAALPDAGSRAGARSRGSPCAGAP